jgi:hypothetical protein
MTSENHADSTAFPCRFGRFRGTNRPHCINFANVQCAGASNVERFRAISARSFLKNNGWRFGDNDKVESAR